MTEKKKLCKDVKINTFLHNFSFIFDCMLCKIKGFKCKMHNKFVKNMAFVVQKAIIIAQMHNINKKSCAIPWLTTLFCTTFAFKTIKPSRFTTSTRLITGLHQI